MIVGKDKDGTNVIRMTPEELAAVKNRAEQLERQELARARKLLRAVLEIAKSDGLDVQFISEMAFNHQISWYHIIKAKKQMGLRCLLRGRVRYETQRWVLPEHLPARK